MAAYESEITQFLKQLKHAGITLGLYRKPEAGSVLEDWELDQLALQLPPACVSAASRCCHRPPISCLRGIPNAVVRAWRRNCASSVS